MAALNGIRRKVFVSFYGGDATEVRSFLTKWADQEKVFIPKVLHDAYSGDFVDSDNTDYVMSVIRRNFLGDSTVTLLLLGRCTHSRRYVDWELKASLRQGEMYMPNGLLAVSLRHEALHLPPRFEDNWKADDSGYARYYRPPTSAEQLRSWIEEAVAARTSRAHLISNSQDMMRRNAQCCVCGETHPAG